MEALGDKRGDVLSKFANVKKLDDTVRSHDRIKAYLEKRPKSDI